VCVCLSHSHFIFETVAHFRPTGMWMHACDIYTPLYLDHALPVFHTPSSREAYSGGCHTVFDTRDVTICLRVYGLRLTRTGGRGGLRGQRFIYTRRVSIRSFIQYRPVLDPYQQTLMAANDCRLFHESTGRARE
jgi:hypothetical protein